MPKGKKKEIPALSAYDDAELRLKVDGVIKKELPALFDKYVEWIGKNDVAQGRWKPDFTHFIAWLKEYYN